VEKRKAGEWVAFRASPDGVTWKKAGHVL